MATLYQEQTSNARTILTAMGMGQYNQAMVIPYLFIPVSTTDPDMAQIQLIVSLVQRRLTTLGHPVADTGLLDPPTLAALKRYTGPAWARMSWAEVLSCLIAGTDHTWASGHAPAPNRSRAQALSGFADTPSSAFTSGLVVGAVGYVLFRHWQKKRRGR